MPKKKSFPLTTLILTKRTGAEFINTRKELISKGKPVN